MTPPPPQQRSRCRFCGLILHAWLPAFQQPNGALRLGHLNQSHRAESRPSIARMRVTEDIARVSAEAFEVIEESMPC